LDKWEGPLSARTLYYRGDTVRAPIMAPLGQSKSELEIYTDLCEKMGKLTDKDGFVDRVNQALKIKDEYLLPLDRKPTPEQILDAWSRSKLNIGLDELRGLGVVSSKIPADKLYLSVGEEPFHNVRGHFYLEVFVKLRDEMRNRGVYESLWSKYAAYPVWTEPAMEGSPPEYDLYLMDFKRIEHKQTRTTNNPLLRELMTVNPLVMNVSAATQRGLEDGDLVWVESHNAVTGETRKVKTTLATVQGIRPDTVGLTHHVGRPDEPSVNSLLFYGDGFWDLTASWFSHAKVKVTKAN
jgi:anaerobic selenocysteine-containing dehydrogenase